MNKLFWDFIIGDMSYGKVESGKGGSVSVLLRRQEIERKIAEAEQRARERAVQQSMDLRKQEGPNDIRGGWFGTMGR